MQKAPTGAFCITFTLHLAATWLKDHLKWKKNYDRIRQVWPYTVLYTFGFNSICCSGPQISSVGAAVNIADEVLEAIAKVRSDEDPTRWMVAEYK